VPTVAEAPGNEIAHAADLRPRATGPKRVGTFRTTCTRSASQDIRRHRRPPGRGNPANGQDG
jgi:hypothetical protein